MTTTINPTGTTAVPCPSWCTQDHTDMPPGSGFHAGHSNNAIPGLGRLWLTDQPGARPGVVMAGELLSEAQADDLACELLVLVDTLRRERERAEVAR